MLSDDQILLETPKHPQLDPILLIAEFDRMDGDIRITHRSSLATHRRPTDERVRIGEKINQHPLLRRKLRYTP